MITYEKYPLLLFTSYDKDTAPDELPFEMPDEEVSAAVQASAGFRNMLAEIAIRNSVEKKNTTTNYRLIDNTYQQVEHNSNFRNVNFSHFFSEYITPKRGVILFREGGTYLYNLLSKQDTQKLLNRSGRYMSVAMFVGNMFVGFEECIFDERGINPLPGGIYVNGMDIGGYLSFVAIALAYAKGRPENLIHAPAVQENIILL